VAESYITCSSSSRRPVRKLLDTPSYVNLQQRHTLGTTHRLKVCTCKETIYNGNHASPQSMPMQSNNINLYWRPRTTVYTEITQPEMQMSRQISTVHHKSLFWPTPSLITWREWTWDQCQCVLLHSAH